MKSKLTQYTVEARIRGERVKAEIGEKCAHKAQGQWCIVVEGYLRVFDPPTQLQKDIWLGNMQDRALRLGMLRWYCAECGTVQEP